MRGIKALISLLGWLTMSQTSLGGTSTLPQGLSSNTKLSLEDKLNIARERCLPPTSDEETLYRNDVRTDLVQTYEQMAAIYQDVYNSPRRLPNRVELNQETGDFTSSDHRSSYVFPEHFLKTIILHVENALKLKYVDFIFFPDMGHSHFLIPQAYYEQSLSRSTHKNARKNMEKLLRDNPKGLKTLYHTAEHLKMLDKKHEPLPDRYTQWRLFTRNPVMDSDGKIEIFTNYNDSKANSVSNSVEKSHPYRYYAGYNISANKNGCFPFEDEKGEIQFFDLSFWDLETDCERSNCGEDM